MVPGIVGGLLDQLRYPASLVEGWGEAATDPALIQLCAGIFDRLRDAVFAYPIGAFGVERTAGKPTRIASRLQGRRLTITEDRWLRR